MKIKLLLIIVLLLPFFSASAQTNTIKGVVEDISSNAKLKNATVSILNAKDSTLYKFARADAEGNFAFKDLKSGNFILLLSYPEYADFVNKFTLDSANRDVNFKTIDMKTKAKLLNEVLIKGQMAAIKINGDTTEFNASAYKIQPNDRVEDLLKKLPGIQVDANGKITAQGKTVEKVLLDGEEFFGDDPTLVTKNIRADMVDKVQLFEKTSDQAAFSGVDDGQKTQTLNIKLKEDKKQGYFGKADAGYGTDDFYTLQGMFNKFKKKEKVAAYFTRSNTGKTGLDWDDANKYGTSNNMQMSDDGMMMFYSGGDEFDGGTYWGEGIPLANNGGAHYENKWKNDQHSLNTNYKVGSLNVQKDKNTIVQNNLPANIFNSTSNELRESNLFRQKIDATYSLKIDTTAILKLRIDATLKNTDSEQEDNGLSRRADNSLLNTTKNSRVYDGKQQSLNFDALYTKKLKKLGRNYTLNVNNGYMQLTNDGYQKTKNDFFDENGDFKSATNVDQYKESDVLSNKISSNFTFTEPITKFSNLVANYGFSYQSSTADKKTFDASIPGKYDQLNSEFSNNFEANQLINQAGAVLTYKKAKTIASLGSKVSFVNFDQQEVYSQTNFKRNFVNVLPQASYQYKFSAQKSISFNYNGSATQPSVDQLQPVKTNDDPLNITEGNPDLEAAYNSRFSFRYNSYKVLTNTNMYVSGSFGFVHNQIVSDNVTDLEGRTTYKSSNLESETPTNFNLYGGYSRKVKALGGLSLGLNVSARGNTYYNYVNSQLNTTKSQGYGPSISLNNYTEKTEFYISFGRSYNLQESSLQKQINNNGWGSNGYLNLRLKLPKSFAIRANGEYTYQPKSASFDRSFEQFVLNTSLEKSFFKEKSLKLSLSGNDLLNQNRGFRRSASANRITETSYNNVARYFMFNVVWDFNKMGGGLKKQ